MSVRTNKLKLLSAAGAALALTAAVSAPALAATHDLTYNCTVGTPAPLGPMDATLDPGAVPATLIAGQSVNRTMTLVFHLSQTQTGAAQTFGTSVSGTVGSTGPLAFQMTIPATPIPGGLGATMDVPASGPGTITATKAGSFKVNARTIDATLNITGGAGPVTAAQTCTAPADGTQTVGTITVAKDKTTTATTATYSAAKDIASGKAKVKSHFGLKPTGKVKFTLKKGTHNVATLKGAVNKKGIAKVQFKGVKAKGKYSITGKYLGNSNLKPSSSKDTFTVS